MVYGSESSTISVLSGVLQGSVLDPLIFLIYIDDLPDSIANDCLMVNRFADDVLLYHNIAKEVDFEALQTALFLIVNEGWSISNFITPNACKYTPESRFLPGQLPSCNYMENHYTWLNATNTWVSHSPAICRGQLT